MTELRIQAVSFNADKILVRFADGKEIAVALSYFPRLEAATRVERERWSLIGRGLGVHWEAVDEDLSVENFLTAYSRQQKTTYAHPAPP